MKVATITTNKGDIRIELFDDKIESIADVHKISGKKINDLNLSKQSKDFRFVVDCV